MNIAINGCFHGEIERVYETMKYTEEQKKIKIDALICCGDFQAIRNETDLNNMHCPKKYQSMGTFWEYYAGLKKAPYLTILIGGNHEASNHMRELHFGGWVAPNMYYLGHSGSIILKKKQLSYRLSGSSGIFKSQDFYKCPLESLPLDQSTKVSIYHTKQIDIFKLSMLKEETIDIFLSHDWPTKATSNGNSELLYKIKPFFLEEGQKEQLGNPANQYLLDLLKPEYWFAGHLHVKYPAIFQHVDGAQTKFLALDKCLPHRQFLQVVNFQPNNFSNINLLEKQDINNTEQEQKKQQTDNNQENKQPETENKEQELQEKNQENSENVQKEVVENEGWGNEQEENGKQEEQKQDETKNETQNVQQEIQKELLQQLSEKKIELQQQEKQNQTPQEIENQNIKRYQYIQQQNDELTLEYDPAWLAILKETTSEYIKVGQLVDFYQLNQQQSVCLPKQAAISKQKVHMINIRKFKEEFAKKDLKIPNNFKVTVKTYDPSNKQNGNNPDKTEINNQTADLLDFIGVDQNQFDKFLYYNNEKQRTDDLKEMQKIVKNTEEINLDLEESEKKTEQVQEVNQDEKKQKNQDEQETNNEQTTLENKTEENTQNQTENTQNQTENTQNQIENTQNPENTINKEELPFL